MRIKKIKNYKVVKFFLGSLNRVFFTCCFGYGLLDGLVIHFFSFQSFLMSLLFLLLLHWWNINFPSSWFDKN
jgi:hypothetical protein